MLRRTMMASAIAVVTARVVAPIRYPPGVFKKGVPERGAKAVAGLTSRHRAVLARAARNKLHSSWPGRVEWQGAWSGRDRRMAHPLPRFILRGRQFLPPLGFAQPTPACLGMEDGTLSADQSE